MQKTRPYTTFSLFAFALALTFSLFVSTTAQANTERAQDFVQKLGEDALSKLESADGDHEVISQGMREWIEKYFDRRAIAQFTMGRHWRDMDDAQKTEFQTVFKEMVVVTYSQRLREYSGEGFNVRGTTRINDRDTIVHSEIIPTRRGAPQTRIDWRVRNTNGDMKVIDILVEGVSMSVTQRADFNAVIQRKGGDIDDFIAELRSKIG